MSEKIARLDKSVIDMVYPVGAIYMSVNSTNPGNLFGGTWEQIKDRFMLACGNTYAAGSTGGEATHTLTIDELARHDHVEAMQAGNGLRANCVMKGSGDRSGVPLQVDQYETKAIVLSTNETGGSKAHNNMPPYLAVYMWKRTA